MIKPIPLTDLSTEEKYTDFLTNIEAETGKQIDNVILKQSKGVAEICIIFVTK